MPYRRPINSYKKYTSPVYSPNPPYSMNSPSPEQYGDLSGIPLPNEREPGFEKPATPRFASRLSEIANYIRRHIKIEDIILIGLIILMLDESIEDDLLLIILIYILLF